MDIKLTIKDKFASWTCLPVTATLFEYLDKGDFIELSKCNKFYRKKLEPEVFKKLSLSYWRRNNRKLYYELDKACKTDKVLEYLENDLSSKLKFVKEFVLDCNVGYDFAQIFIKLLPNIKSLSLNAADEYGCCLGEGLSAILKGMEHLEHVYIRDIVDKISNYGHEGQIFPKSIKSLKIKMDTEVGLEYSDDELSIYNTIDTSYINLSSLTVVSNRMLENLSSGIPNLKKVEIIDYDCLDQSKLVEFLKTNPQLRKLKTILMYYNEEIVKTILCSKYLEYWCIDSELWKGIANDLPFNYSIKYLNVSTDVPAPLILQIVNSCKVLETLKLKCYNQLNLLDLSKLMRKINKLKINFCYSVLNFIKKVDSSRLFNEVYIEECNSLKKSIEYYNIGKVINYKQISLISGTFILKLINNID